MSNENVLRLSQFWGLNDKITSLLPFCECKLVTYVFSDYCRVLHVYVLLFFWIKTEK